MCTFTQQVRYLTVSVVIIFGLLEFMGIALLKGKHYLLKILQDQSCRVCLVSGSVSSVYMFPTFSNIFLQYYFHGSLFLTLSQLTLLY